jgi:hypothetical protein
LQYLLSVGNLIVLRWSVDLSAHQDLAHITPLCRVI